MNYSRKIDEAQEQMNSAILEVAQGLREDGWWQVAVAFGPEGKWDYAAGYVRTFSQAQEILNSQDYAYTRLAESLKQSGDFLKLPQITALKAVIDKLFEYQKIVLKS
jgi:hypothetical protein